MSWITAMGKWFPGDKVMFRERNLLEDLVQDMDWMALYLYGITGREFDAKQLDLLQSMWTHTSFPDPRLWNNRVAALAGTARSTPTLGICAALAVSESTLYGHGPCVWALDFLYRAKRCVDEGGSLKAIVDSELKKNRTVYGYGRPVTNKDERIEPMMCAARKNAADQGQYVLLAFEIDCLLKKWRGRFSLNAAGLYAALVADMGFSTREFHLFMVPVFLAGMPPCYIDTADRCPESFFPLKCEQIVYTGKPYRRWNDVSKKVTESV